MSSCRFRRKSAAKLAVKVRNRTLPSVDCARCLASHLARCMATTVLPVPAPPRTRTGPFQSRSTSRLCDGCRNTRHFSCGASSIRFSSSSLSTTQRRPCEPKSRTASMSFVSTSVAGLCSSSRASWYVYPASSISTAVWASRGKRSATVANPSSSVMDLARGIRSSGMLSFRRLRSLNPLNRPPMGVSAGTGSLGSSAAATGCGLNRMTSKVPESGLTPARCRRAQA